MKQKKRAVSIRRKMMTASIVIGALLAALFFWAALNSFSVIFAALLAVLLFVIAIVLAVIASSYSTDEWDDLKHSIYNVREEEDWPKLKAQTKESEELAVAIAEVVSSIHKNAKQHEAAAKHSSHTAIEMGDTMQNFMYWIAHTLRTPLNAMRWSIELLKNEELGTVSEAQREYLDQLERSSIQILEISDQLQDAMIVMQGEPLVIETKETDIVEILEQAMGEWAVAARQKKIQLSLEVPAGGIRSVMTDPDRISQVANTLIENAIRYTKPEKKIHLHILEFSEKIPAAIRKNWVIPTTIKSGIIVCVKDQGIGIAEGDKKRIFQAFYRGENAKSVWSDGKGVGLTLSLAIIKQLGGQMWIASAKGRGTAVYFSLPLVKHPHK